MTAPLFGAEGWDGNPRPDDIWHLSASTIGKALARPKLDQWAERETANRVIDDIDVIGPLARRSRDAAVAYVKGIRYTGTEGRLSAADRGTELHSYVEARLKGLPVPVWDGAVAEQLAPYVPHIEVWLSEYRPEPLEVEAAVYDPAARLAGRLDWKVRLPGTFEPWPGVVWHDPVVVVDGKSSDKPYDRVGNVNRPFADSHGLQLATLVHATHLATWTPRISPGLAGGRFYLANPTELAAAATPAAADGAVILQMTPAHCTPFPIDVSLTVHQYARCVADSWRWAHLVSKSTVGNPLVRQPITATQGASS